MIVGHVAGLIQSYKELFINSFRNSKYNIVDLDDITDSIMNDDLMIELVKKLKNQGQEFLKISSSN